jgi:hypothetical protein
MTHAWCHDIDRDAAVRAAEDNRTGPLPTLGECIDGMFPKSGSASSAVEQENKGDGMRTERVVLEITQFNDGGYKPASEWDWDFFLRGEALTHGESVRVVEEAVVSVDDRAYADRMGCDEERDFANRILAERDAAIRERDEARQVAQTFESLCLGEQARNKVLQARVAALEAASGGGEGGPYMVTASGIPLYRSPPQSRGWLSEEEREAVDAARDYFDDDDHGDSECVFIARVLKQLLARSTPPEPERQ